MARYSVGTGVTTIAGPTAPSAYMQVRAGSSLPVTVYEIAFFLTAATATNVCLVRASATGTASTQLTPVADDGTTPTPGWRFDRAWSTAPTAGTGYIRNVSLPATVGAGYTMVFPSGITIPVNGGLLAINPTGGAAATLWHVTADE